MSASGSGQQTKVDTRAWLDFPDEDRLDAMAAIGALMAKCSELVKEPGIADELRFRRKRTAAALVAAFDRLGSMHLERHEQLRAAMTEAVQRLPTRRCPSCNADMVRDALVDALKEDEGHDR